MSDWKQRLSADGTGLRPRTLIEIYGKERLLVEQHRGILAYGDECIRIGTSFGEVRVEGADLRLCCMSRQQVVIRGRIDAVRTEEGS
jgi:sporulation protein YqfC